jgi:formiminotetrahydrofolate cyclodeaminase
MGLSDHTVTELLDSMSAGALGPAGGTAASIAGALGVSLLLMATTLRTKRAHTSSAGGELRIVTARLQVARDRLVHLAERDAQAYAQVIEARRRPENTPAEKLARQITVQDALRGATDVPLDMMHACDQALMCGTVVASHASANARGDLAIAIELLCVALHGAARAIDANLARLIDERYVASVTEQCLRFEANGTQTIGRIHRELYGA